VASHPPQPPESGIEEDDHRRDEHPGGPAAGQPLGVLFITTGADRAVISNRPRPDMVAYATLEGADAVVRVRLK
jgi:hypothetical protein